jgi:hypothetical protein
MFRAIRSMKTATDPPFGPLPWWLGRLAEERVSALAERLHDNAPAPTAGRL